MLRISETQNNEYYEIIRNANYVKYLSNAHGIKLRTSLSCSMYQPAAIAINFPGIHLINKNVRSLVASVLTYKSV